MLTLQMGGSMMYAIEVASCGFVYIPRFMKIDAGVPEILRFYLM
jgi:hypothetical protein